MGLRRGGGCEACGGVGEYVKRVVDLVNIHHDPMARGVQDFKKVYRVDF
jgi:hypothetical protein